MRKGYEARLLSLSGKHVSHALTVVSASCVTGGNLWWWWGCCRCCCEVCSPWPDARPGSIIALNSATKTDGNQVEYLPMPATALSFIRLLAVL